MQRFWFALWHAWAFPKTAVVSEVRVHVCPSKNGGIGDREKETQIVCGGPWATADRGNKIYSRHCTLTSSGRSSPFVSWLTAAYKWSVRISTQTIDITVMCRQGTLIHVWKKKKQFQKGFIHLNLLKNLSCSIFLGWPSCMTDCCNCSPQIKEENKNKSTRKEPKRKAEVCGVGVGGGGHNY